MNEMDCYIKLYGQKLFECVPHYLYYQLKEKYSRGVLTTLLMMSKYAGVK